MMDAYIVSAEKYLDSTRFQAEWYLKSGPRQRDSTNPFRVLDANPLTIGETNAMHYRTLGYDVVPLS